MTVIKEVNGITLEIRLNDLYRTREDNSLTVDELVKKYEKRLLEGSIPSIERDAWELKAQNVIDTLNDIGHQIKSLKEIYKTV